ncbi:MAG: GNAT family N-acetyltransferase, partial [Chitinophagaceae bacterium]|nr:GNAT family N-acetyltransferase [Chitinophagaceae bacterium]
GLQMLTAGLILLPVCFLTGRYTNLANAGAESWYALAYLVILGSCLGYSAYVVAINKLPPTQVSVYAYINPIVAIAFGWLLLDEKMNAHIILGTMITIAGVYLVSRDFKKQQHMDHITIVDYESAHQPYFEKFNRAWIEEYFTMEPLDEYVLKNPEEAILRPGGAILMAVYKGDVAGTVGLRKLGDSVYEFTKMAVDEKFRRRGIAEAISIASLEKAKQLGATEVVLYSNTKNEAAIKLYEKLGFRHLQPEQGVYQRANVKMTIEV